jgi:hypothetical protein
MQRGIPPVQTKPAGDQIMENLKSHPMVELPKPSGFPEIQQ